MHAFQHSMDSIANDIANVNTTSYKAKHVQFDKLIENTQTDNNKMLLGNNLQEVTVSSGVKSTIGNSFFTQGSPSSAGIHQLAVTGGDGFFKVTDGTGQSYLTRDGDFQINADRTITNHSGDKLEIQTFGTAQENWPEGSLLIQTDGVIQVRTKNDTILLGRINLYKPENLDTLVSVGKNKYAFLNGNIQNSLDSTENFGNIQQQYLENSNVDLATRMTDMIVAQRAYALNVKAAQSTDEMMGMVNNFKQ